MLLNIHELHKWEKTSLGLMTFRERREEGGGGHGGIDTRWGRGVQGCSVERGCGWHPWGGGWEGWWDSIGPLDTGHWVQLGTLSSLSFCNREWSCMGGLKAAANLGGGVTVAPPPAWSWGMKGSTMDWAMKRAGLGATSLGH